MAKSSSRSTIQRDLAVTLAAVVAIALVGCGGRAGALSAPAAEALPAADFRVAPIEGSPEETMFELDASWTVAPTEGSPEETAIELRR